MFTTLNVMRHASNFSYLFSDKLYIKIFIGALIVVPSLAGTFVHAETKSLEVVKDHSTTLTVPENVKTMIIGNPEVAKAVALKPNTILINGVLIGSTSLTMIGKSGSSYEYIVQVTHDLTLLKKHLRKIDPRIEAYSDTNGDSIILSGVAANKELVNRAEEAAMKFFGDYTKEKLVVNMPESETVNNLNPGGSTGISNKNKIAGAENQVNQFTNSYTKAGEIAYNKTRVVNLIISEETLLPAPLRLQALLKQIDKRITVEEVNSVFVLHGQVKSAAALTRVLSIADRFVQGSGEPDFSVISDQGGVLAGNLDEKEELEVVKSNLVVQSVNAGGNRNGGGGGSNNRGGGTGGGRNNNMFNQPIMQNKGNLAQNISRGDVVMAANGRVMSLVRVEQQPRIEMQMRIIAIDRNKTDEFGIDWRLDGKKVSIGSKNGNVVDTLPSAQGAFNSTTGVNTGTANLLGFFLPGSYGISAFINAVEEKGAGKSLSEPLLTAVSGESTSFLAGGSLPIPVQTLVAGNATSNALSATNVQFIEFGLSLKVRPTLLENGKISIILDQTISEPDYTRNIQILGTPIPSFKQRTVSTVTESEDGETWAIAGLLTEEDTKTYRNVPLLSEIPVIGYLFRNSYDNKARNELIITVTARTVDDQKPLPVPTIQPVAKAVKLTEPQPVRPAPTPQKTPNKNNIVVTTESAPRENQSLMQNTSVYKKTRQKPVSVKPEPSDNLSNSAQ